MNEINDLVDAFLDRLERVSLWVIAGIVAAFQLSPFIYIWVLL